MNVPSQNLNQIPVGDKSTSQWGGTFLPLGPDTGQPLPAWWQYAGLLRDADPARFYALDFFIWSLNFMVGQRLAQEAKKAGVPLEQAVSGVSLVDPEPFFASSATEFRFPLLALYRQRSKADYTTMVYAHRTGIWELRYTLPAMNYDQAQKLEPILVAIEAALDAAVENGFHPQYAPPMVLPPGQSALGVQGWKLAGFEEIDSTDTAWSHAPGDETTGGEVHLSYTMTIEVKTRRMPILAPLRGAPVPFGGVTGPGVDIDLAVAPEGGATPTSPALDAVVQVAADVVPPVPG
jgi:hypothetical protein